MTQRVATLVLAGSRPGSDPLLEGTGLPSKALLPIAGKPMLAHVLEALNAAAPAGPGSRAACPRCRPPRA